MKPLIYKITSPSGKVYIGQSWNWIKRKSIYKRRVCKNQRFLYNSLIKYGWDSHISEILEEFSEDIIQSFLDEREIYWWKFYKDQGIHMLNIKEPGRGGKTSPESVAKNKASRLANVKKNGYWFSPEVLSKRTYGKKVIDTVTGEIYNMIQDAAPFYNTTPQYLAAMLRGFKKNRTNLIYYKNGS